MGLLFSKLWSLFGNEGEQSKLLSLTDVWEASGIPSSAVVPDWQSTSSLVSPTCHKPLIPPLIPEHKIVMVGLDNAGKTTILYQFLMNEVVQTSPTIGSNVEEVVFRNIHFLVWDLGGQQSLRSAWSTYYTNTEFIIMVIDSTDRERLVSTREELYKMLQHEDLSKASL